MIVGISGRMGAGKDTLGDFLVKRHGFVRLAFADTLKDVAGILMQRPGRKDYQSLARLREVMGDDVWITPVADRIMSYEPSTNFVITDVRYPNEVDWIHGNGGVVIRLDVMATARRGRIVSRDGTAPSGAEWARQQHHDSECALDEYGHRFDMIIEATELAPEAVYRMATQLIVTEKLLNAKSIT